MAPPPRSIVKLLDSSEFWPGEIAPPGSARLNGTSSSQTTTEATAIPQFRSFGTRGHRLAPLTVQH